MNIEHFISESVNFQLGINETNKYKKFIWIISELETTCDINGIDSFIDNYGKLGIQIAQLAYEFIGAKELKNSLFELENDIENQVLLSKCNNMVTNRLGYNYNSIESATKKIAQQVDAPEPATMVSPALQKPNRPAR